MAGANEPVPVKLICGMISARQELFDVAAGKLAETFGPADIVSEVMDFDFTHYYDGQMGSPLYRRFLAFERLVSPEELVDAKHRTNELEADFAAQAGGEPPRPINLDPGYVEASKLVLASMKNFSHRIYLGRRVYGEITLMYRRGAWGGLEWTFPDYASGRYHAFLTAVRSRLAQQLRPPNRRKEQP